MKSKALSFNLNNSFKGSISISLLKENIRKLWPLSLLLTLLMIIPTLLLFLIRDANQILIIGESLLDSRNIVHMFTYSISPILASIMVFKYLYKQGSISVLHSMPFTRQTLFWTNWLSGFIILVVPILINTIILFPVANYTKENSHKIQEGGAELLHESVWFDNFSPEHVINWLIVSLLIVTFIYALSCLVGMMTGTVIMHGIGAIIINYAPIFLFFIIGSYLGIELKGFDNYNFLYVNLKWFTPLWESVGIFSGFRWLFFLGVIIVSTLLARLLYKHRHIERGGDSLVFKFADHVAVFLMTLMGTAFICIYIYLFSEGGFEFYVSLAATSFIFLLISNMIVQKTPRIFNKKTLIDIIAYTLIIGIFLIGVTKDFIGIESKIPETEKIAYVKLKAPAMSYIPYVENTYIYDDNNKNYTFKSKEAIKYIAAYHKDLINNPKLLKENNTDFEDSDLNASIYLEYHLTSGDTMNRVYYVADADYKNNENIKKLSGTDEYKQNLRLENIGYNRFVNIPFDIVYLESINREKDDFNNGDDDESDGFYTYKSKEYALYIKKEEQLEILKCLDRDFMEQTPGELNNKEKLLAVLKLEVNPDPKEQDDDNDFEYEIKYIRYAIPSTYDHTIKWMKEKGYYDNIVFTAEDIAKIKVEIIQNNAVIKEVDVTEKGKIKELYDSGSILSDKSNDYAVLAIDLNNKGAEKMKKLGALANTNDGYVETDEGELEISNYNFINRLYIDIDNAVLKGL